MTRSRKRGRVSARKWREEVRGGSNYLKVPEGVKRFEGKPGTYRLDFMSFLAGKGNPRAEPGEPHIERTFFVHQNIGANQDWHLCPARTYKEKCPVCQYRAKLSADPEADETLIKSLAAKERQLWLLKDLTNDPDGLFLWEVSYHLFGRQLKDKINSSDEEDGYDFFADPTEGMTMRLALQQSDAGKWTEVGDIEFRPRKKQYDSDIVDEMPCLDEMLVTTPYDKYKSLLFQTEATESDEEQSDRRGKSPNVERRERDPAKEETVRREISAGDTVWYKGMECVVLRVSGDGTSLMLEDSKDVIHKAVDPLNDLEEPPKGRTEKIPSEQDKKEGAGKSAKGDDDWDDGTGSSPREEAPTTEESDGKKSNEASGDDDWDNW